VPGGVLRKGEIENKKEEGGKKKGTHKYNRNRKKGPLYLIGHPKKLKSKGKKKEQSRY